MIDSEKLFDEFNRIFPISKNAIRQFKAPARINIIGEHVDYLGGIVLPAAIDFSIHCLIQRNDSENFSFYSSDFKQLTELSRPFENSKIYPWSDYILGVLVEFEKKGYNIPGLNILIQGDIPQGAGLSSSAALEIVICYAIVSLLNLKISIEDMAVLCQAAENNFVGTKCGIMDQFVIATGKIDNCISLNTDSLEYQYHHFDLKEFEFYLINSNVKHNLKESSYNKRREECESALAKIRNEFPDLSNLYSFLLPAENWNLFHFSKEERARVLHVTEERERTKRLILALEKGNLTEVGKILYECHNSLSQNFEVSCAETDAIVANLTQLQVPGARMIGGGFGGCVLVLDKIENFSHVSGELQKNYLQRFGHRVEFYKFKISDGVKEIK